MQFDYGQGYVYAHDTREKLSAMQCMPDSLKDRRYYHPTEQGEEKKVREHLESVLQWKKEHAKE